MHGHELLPGKWYNVVYYCRQNQDRQIAKLADRKLSGTSDEYLYYEMLTL